MDEKLVLIRVILNLCYKVIAKEKAEAMRDYMIKQQIGKAASMERINSVSPKEFTEYYMNEHYGDTKKDD